MTRTFLWKFVFCQPEALSKYRLLSGWGCILLLGCSPLVRSAGAGAANDNLAWLLRLMLISTPPPSYHQPPAYYLSSFFPLPSLFFSIFFCSATVLGILCNSVYLIYAPCHVQMCIVQKFHLGLLDWRNLKRLNLWTSTAHTCRQPPLYSGTLAVCRKKCGRSCTANIIILPFYCYIKLLFAHGINILHTPCRAALHAGWAGNNLRGKWIS